MQTKILLFAVILILGGFFYLHTINPTDAAFVLSDRYRFVLPVTVLLFIGFALGAVLAVLNSAFGEALRSLREMKARRREKLLLQGDMDFNAAMDSLAKGDASKAADFMEKALSARDGSKGLTIAYAETLMEDGRDQEAVKALEKGLQKNPGSVALLFTMARACLSSGDRFRAVRALEEITTQDPRNIRAQREIRDIKAGDKLWGDAVKVQEKIISLERDSLVKGAEKATLTGFLYEAAADLLGRGRYEEALAKAGEVLKTNDAFIPAHVLSGEVYYAENNTIAAIKSWERSLDRYPLAAALLLRLEDAYMKEGSGQNMVRRYHKSIELYPAESAPVILLARLYLRLDMPEEAVREIERLDEAVRSRPYPRLLLGVAYSRLGSAESGSRLMVEALGLKDVPPPPFKCSSCGVELDEWCDRCPSCAMWDTVVMELARVGAYRQTLKGINR